ncbi:MAG: FMN-binding protein [Kiritimatiellales bacterium]|nr:FMN-binding protein [Kiritimatiellales bacterium]
MAARKVKTAICVVCVTCCAVLSLFGSGGGVADWKAVMPKVFSGGDEFYEVPLGETAPDDAHLYVASKKTKPIGYGVELTSATMSGPMRLLVMMDHKHSVKYVYILSYPYKHGAEVCNRKFLKQFEGTGAKEKLKVGENVDGITGATNSVKATTRGVNKALELFGAYLASLEKTP